MKSATKMLWALFVDQPKPARVHHRVNGTTSFVWYVDNDDDRYVEVSDSVNSDDFLVVRRDHRRLWALVIGDPGLVVEAVRQGLDVLSGKKDFKEQPRGIAT
jgi:hypothetical protein